MGDNKLDEFEEYSANDILSMLKDLPDACCVFKIITDPFGTVRDMLFLFANEKYASLVGKPSAELIGATYYQTVSNRDEDWIKLSYQSAIMRQSVINRTFNTQFEKWFEFWAVPVYKKGFCAFIIHDVTAEKRKEESREIVSKSNNVIIECSKVLSESEFKKGIKSALKILGGVLKADRVYVVEAKDGEVGETYEWTDRMNGRGLPSKKDFEKYDFFTMWNKQMAGNSVVVVEDTKCVESKNKQVYDEVLSGKISRYVITALMDKNEIIGYMLADNYGLNLDIDLYNVMESVSIFVSEELRNFNLTSEMTYMSTHDVLTDLGNRHSFNATLRMLEGADGCVGICFVDINGLKAINDASGHEAGDKVITEAAAAISTVFKKKYCYRIGGDEFVAVVPGMTESHFYGQIEKLQKKSKKISMAIGAIWRDNSIGLEDMVNVADKLMYNDKAMFYTDGNDRRH